MSSTTTRPNRLAALVAGVFVFATLCGHAGRAEAATVTVTNCNDSGPGSLRNAVARAHSGDKVDLRRLSCTIVLTRGAIEIGAAFRRYDSSESYWTTSVRLAVRSRPFWPRPVNVSV